MNALEKGLDLCIENKLLYKEGNKIKLVGNFINDLMSALENDTTDAYKNMFDRLKFGFTKLDTALMLVILARVDANEEQLALMSAVIKRPIVMSMNQYWKERHGDLPMPRLW